MRLNSLMNLSAGDDTPTVVCILPDRVHRGAFYGRTDGGAGDRARQGGAPVEGQLCGSHGEAIMRDY